MRSDRGSVHRSLCTTLAVGALVLLAASCGDSDDATPANIVVTEPTPPQMCPEGSWPLAAAYEKDTGEFSWASCTDEIGWHTVVHVGEDAVYLQSNFPDRTIVALDPADGSTLADAPGPPIEDEPEEYTGEPTIIEVDGYEVRGGQDDPVSVQTPDGTSWTRDGVWAYDDVYAIGDGAVFAVERMTGSLVAYELASGDVRWTHEGDPYAEGLWPWLVDGQRLYTLWYDLQVRSTVDGSLIWRTDYGLVDPNEGFQSPSTEAPRMSGVGVGDDLVYVSFTTEASGGD